MPNTVLVLPTSTRTSSPPPFAFPFFMDQSSLDHLSGGHRNPPPVAVQQQTTGLVETRERPLDHRVPQPADDPLAGLVDRQRPVALHGVGGVSQMGELGLHPRHQVPGQVGQAPPVPSQQAQGGPGLRQVLCLMEEIDPEADEPHGALARPHQRLDQDAADLLALPRHLDQQVVRPLETAGDRQIRGERPAEPHTDEQGEGLEEGLIGRLDHPRDVGPLAGRARPAPPLAPAPARLLEGQQDQRTQPLVLVLVVGGDGAGERVGRSHLGQDHHVLRAALPPAPLQQLPDIEIVAIVVHGPPPSVQPSPRLERRAACRSRISASLARPPSTTWAGALPRKSGLDSRPSARPISAVSLSSSFSSRPRSSALMAVFSTAIPISTPATRSRRAPSGTGPRATVSTRARNLLSGACSWSTWPTDGSIGLRWRSSFALGGSPISVRRARTRVTTWVRASMPASAASSSHASSRRGYGARQMVSGWIAS